MTIFQAIILGIVQGITEFLPVSSSGHLVLTPFFFGWTLPSEEAFVFNVLVQVGTLVAVIAYFWRDLVEIAVAFLGGLARQQPFADPMARLGWLLILASIPAGIFGLALEDAIESAFNSPVATAFFLLVTAVLLLIAERLGARFREMKESTWMDALFIGFFQVLSLFPGISRSGSTITGGMLRNLQRTSAARFSFLMSVPIMVAAGLLTVVKMFEIPDLDSFLPAMIVGFITAAVSGYISIHWLLRFLTRRPLYVFAVYVTLVSITTLLVAGLRG
jgi:undecaprenyl-diphosphatase